MSFELVYIGFGQAIASFAANELLASLLVPMFFLFVASFCSVVVPYIALPTFWKSWMYWLSPFKYLLQGLLALVTHGLPIECHSSKLGSFSAPPGQTCDVRAGPYAQRSGGYGKIKNFFSPAARKQKKAAKQRETESQNEKA